MNWKIFILFLLCFIDMSFGWWPFTESEEDREKIDHQNHKNHHSDHISSPSDSSSVVPFETLSVEQKFLQEAKELLDLSPLDQCQHRVVSALKKSCNEMNEEDLAKLSINLLNCQSQNEERETFKCTKEMSVAECTKPMDPHMWNTYHIISNRARSVCYATRQQQFRLQTEAAVNKLSYATLQQLSAMEALAQTNLQIRQATNESLEKLKREQLSLLERQSLLSSSQATLKDSIIDNIHRLTEERTMIEERQMELENITKNIQKQLKLARDMLDYQEKRRQESHNKTTSELDKLSDNVMKVWNKIDTNTNQLILQFSQISSQYQSTLTDLRALNQTVTHLLSLVGNMNREFTQQLNWLLNILGGTQDGLHNLTVLIGHGFYLIGGCLVLLFVGAPWFSRLSLLVSVLVNVTLEIKFGSGFTLTQLTGLIFTIALCDYIAVYYKPLVSLLSNHQNTRRITPSPSLLPPPSSPPPSSSHLPPSSSHLPPSSSPSRPPSLRTPTGNHITEISDEEEGGSDGYVPLFPPPSTPLTASTLSPHHQRRYQDTPTGYHDNRKCASVTRSGLPCRLKPHPHSMYCLRHKRS